MKKLFLLPLLVLTLFSCNKEENDNKKIEIVARYENVLYNISYQTGELTVFCDYTEEENVVYNGKEYKTNNWTYARFITVEGRHNVFFIRKNAPDLLIVCYQP